MLEFILCLPAFLMLVFGIFQFAHIWMARQVVNYAAYSAARSALVTVADPGGERPNFTTDEATPIAAESAKRVTAWLGLGDFSATSHAPVAVPGWGEIAGGRLAADRTDVDVEFDDWNVRATVTHEFSLITPIAGPLIATGHSALIPGPKPTTIFINKKKQRFPTIDLKQTVWLPKPYRTVMARGQ